MLFRSIARQFRQLNHRKYATVVEEVTRWRAKFEEEKILEPESSIRNLVAGVLKATNLSAIDEKANEVLTAKQVEKLESFCHARLAKMPVQYIVGEWNFRGLDLEMCPPVFIPRPETEELVNHVIASLTEKDAHGHVLDIGCGTGAIILSLLNQFPKNLEGHAIDRSKLAVDVTNENAEILGVDLNVVNLELKEETLSHAFLSNLSFRVIVSNPPYIPSQELLDLDDDVKLYEDVKALDGGPDGLKVINLILKLASSQLADNGELWLEVHPTHPALLVKMLDDDSQLQLRVEKTFKDFCGKDRFVKIVRR